MWQHVQNCSDQKFCSGIGKCESGPQCFHFWLNYLLLLHTENHNCYFLASLRNFYYHKKHSIP